MSREALLEAHDLIKAKRYDEARFILKAVDHPTAREWLAKLDQIAPVRPVVENNPFDDPFENPFTSSSRQATPPPPPRPSQPEQQVWLNPMGFSKPATKRHDPQISNGTMILAIGGMLLVAAILVGIVAVLRGGGGDDNDNRSADRNESSSSFDDYDFDSVFEFDLINQGELHYGDVIDNNVRDSTGHIWTFQGSQGERIDVAIESQWDNVLELRDSNGNILIENDDEQGGEFAGDARLYDVQLPYTGTYQVVVRPWGFIAGSYRLWFNKLR